ncbi:MAG: histidine phosphatase family protein [Ponticaulis sp.]|nr:histidine phosphatase family protein [Ponticaulis sp.]|tara:strand:- start:184034 stop:184573 length:540 start_codon:yes stop_codon:yes gene_type:complete
MKNIPSVLGLIFASFCLMACSLAGSAPANAANATLYLVRHAEKETGPDPMLTAEGEARAERLAGLMEKANVGSIWSTFTNRTLLTAEPTAVSLGLQVKSYDAEDLAGFADILKANGGVALVVGHSNTTPVLATALTGRDEGPWFDESDYETLVRVDVNAMGEAVAYFMSYDALEQSLED